MPRIANVIDIGLYGTPWLLRPSAESPTVPSAFSVGQWDVSPGDTEAHVTINSLPSNGGAAISDVEYRVDGGSWISSGDTVDFDITGLTNDQEYDIELRAVNSVGAGPASDVKQVTPASAGDALAILLASLSCAVWHDGADITSHYEERTGSPPSTQSSVNGVVGSIFNKGTGGGYFRPLSDGARGAYRSNGSVQIDGSDDIYQIGTGNVGIAPDTVCTAALIFQALSNDGEGTVVGDNGYNTFGWYNDGDSGTELSSWNGTISYRINGSPFTGTRGQLRTAFLAGPTLLLMEGAQIKSFTNMSYGSRAPGDNSAWFIANGYLFQFVIIPSAISSGDRATLESLLLARL